MRMRNLLLSLLSGVVLAAAMPKPGIWALSWIGLVPLLVALRKSTARQAVVYGLVAGFVYYAIILYWITLFGFLPWVLLSIYQGLFIAVFAVPASRLLRQPASGWAYVTIPAAWTALQWLRSLGPYGFTWGSFAHTQAAYPDMIGIASLTGPWGIDFAVCLANVCLASALLGCGARRQQLVALAAVLPTVMLMWSVALQASWIAQASDIPSVKVAVVQGNTEHGVEVSPEYIVDAFKQYREMTLDAARSHPDVIVWPETTLPINIDPAWDALLSSLARTADSALVVGGYDPSRRALVPESYNSAHFYDRDGVKVGVYHKVHLVPYGEFVPLREKLPFLKNYGIRDIDVLPGESHDLMDTDFGKVGVSICFESLFPQISRLETRDGASLLFVITNDSWFKRSNAALQHLMMAQLRAVENRRYVVRAASTGISAIIKPDGRVVRSAPIYTRRTICEKVTPLSSLTTYARFGDYFAYACAVVVLVSVAGIGIRRVRRPRG